MRRWEVLRLQVWVKQLWQIFPHLSDVSYLPAWQRQMRGCKYLVDLAEVYDHILWLAIIVIRKYTPSNVGASVQKGAHYKWMYCNAADSAVLTTPSRIFWLFPPLICFYSGIWLIANDSFGKIYERCLGSTGHRHSIAQPFGKASQQLKSISVFPSASHPFRLSGPVKKKKAQTTVPRPLQKALHQSPKNSRQVFACFKALHLASRIRSVFIS